jgi:hypothetical protein
MSIILVDFLLCIQKMSETICIANDIKLRNFYISLHVYVHICIDIPTYTYMPMFLTAFFLHIQKIS